MMEIVKPSLTLRNEREENLRTFVAVMDGGRLRVGTTRAPGAKLPNKPILKRGVFAVNGYTLTFYKRVSVKMALTESTKKSHLRGEKSQKVLRNERKTWIGKGVLGYWRVGVVGARPRTGAWVGN